MTTRYIVMTASEKMPSSCKGRYGKIAVIKTDLPEGFYPKMISNRARGVVQIVHEWRRLNIGKTDKCAFDRALKEAKALATELNDITFAVSLPVERNHYPSQQGNTLEPSKKPVERL